MGEVILFFCLVCVCFAGRWLVGKYRRPSVYNIFCCLYSFYDQGSFPFPRNGFRASHRCLWGRHGSVSFRMYPPVKLEWYRLASVHTRPIPILSHRIFLSLDVAAPSPIPWKSTRIRSNQVILLSDKNLKRNDADGMIV